MAWQSLTSIKGPQGPQGPSGAGKKIVVLGDSLSAQYELLDRSWPFILEEYLRSSGAECSVTNLAIGGHTFLQANTNATFPGGKTLVQMANTLEADVILVCLGFNDAFTTTLRTQAQIVADATTTFASLRAASPNAKIFFVQETTCISGVSTSTLLNRHVIPFHMQRKATGYLSGALTPEILPDAVDSAVRARYGVFAGASASIAGLPTVSGSLSIDFYRVARLGGTGMDGLHLTSFGCTLAAAYVAKGLRASAAAKEVFPNLADNTYPVWCDPDVLFTSTWSGTGTTTDYTFTSALESVMFDDGDGRRATPESWLYGSRGYAVSSAASLVRSVYNSYSYGVRNALPYQPVLLSSGGGTFSSTGRSTDASGNCDVWVDGTAFAAGTRVFRVKVGDEVFGPFNLVVSAPTGTEIVDGNHRFSGFTRLGDSSPPAFKMKKITGTTPTEAALGSYALGIAAEKVTAVVGVVRMSNNDAVPFGAVTLDGIIAADAFVTGTNLQIRVNTGAGGYVGSKPFVAYVFYEA